MRLAGHTKTTVSTLSTCATRCLSFATVLIYGREFISSSRPLFPRQSLRPSTYQVFHRHLKPGGWVEISEFQYAAACDDNTCDEPYAWRDFIHYLEQGMKNLGTDLQGITAVDKELAAAGFEDVRIKNLKCPVGPWAKKKKLQECGHVLRDVILFGLDGMARKPFRDGLNWTDIQIQMFLVEVRKAISAERNGLPKFHSYYPFRSVCARKPLDGK